MYVVWHDRKILVAGTNRQEKRCNRHGEEENMPREYHGIMAHH